VENENTLCLQYQYFFEDGPLPIMAEKRSTEVVDSSLEVQSASLLLDNVSKIERECHFLCRNT
jgi:hypothetical protein